MNRKEFEKLVKKNKYQVFLFSSPCVFPINFAAHCWFVTNKKGKINRYEVLHIKGFGNHPDKNTHLYINLSAKDYPKDYFHPASGMNKYIWSETPLWESKLIKSIEGDKNSTAKKIIDFIEKEIANYPYKYKYRLLGPNSNTLPQWIINKFPESGFKLPFNAIGKNYKIKE